MVSIITLTLNPALDVSTAVDVVTPTNKLRCDTPRIEAGGGGVNVARVTSVLGEPTLAIMPLGGANGDRLATQLTAEKVNYRAIHGSSETRQSFSVTERSSNHQYRFVVPGSQLSTEALAQTRAAVREAVIAEEANAIVISGSMPDGLPAGYLSDLIDSLNPLNVIVDTSGPALIEALRSPTRLVKPSARELASVVGHDLLTEGEVESALLEVMGRSQCESLVVSIGPGGAMLADQDGVVTRFRAPTVRVASTIGAGDSMVGAIALALARGQETIEAVRYGIAAGTATVMRPGTSLCEPDTVDALLPYVRVDA